MSDSHDESQPRFVRDCFAISMLAATLVVLVSVITHDAADPVSAPFWPLDQFYQPDTLVYPANAAVGNACGRLGALIADGLLQNLGLSVALVIAAAGGVTTAMFHRGGMNAPVLRSLGGCIALPAAASGLAMLPTQIDGMPVYGNGGRLGAMASMWLLDHFAPTGAWILTLTAGTVGLLLISDYALLVVGKKVLASGKVVSVAGARRMGGAMPLGRRRRQPFTDLETPILVEGDGDDEPQGGLSIKVPKREPASTEQTDSPISIKTPSRIKAAAAAGLAAAAAGLAGRKLATGKSSEDSFSADQDAETWDDSEPSDSHDADDDETWETADDDATDAPTLDIEIDDETMTLREDKPHQSVSSPRIKAPKRKTSESDPKSKLYDSINESAPDASDYRLPSVELLTPGEDVCYEEQKHELRRKARILEETFQSFGFNVKVVEVETGPVIAQYEIELEAGLRLSKITGLADDVAIALRVPSVRIVAPIPGKNTVGIEVPNETRMPVRIRDVIEDSDGKTEKMNIPVFMGQDVSGNPLVVDLAKMPHLLIAGRTGTGKSVCLNAIICSILMCCRPDEVRMLMIDPKMVELSGYGQLPHLMHPVITDMKKAEAILAWAVDKMEERYTLLAKAGVRHINSYNDLGREEVLRRLEIDEDDETTDVPERLPFIVIVADEMADLMMTAGKDVEQHIIRLAQKSRAVGIHLILATQKPTVDVITGLIKSNLPARLSFQVASKTDSRVVLDENGADKLLGMGDMLFLWPGTSTLIRGQGTYLSDDEIDAICEHCSETQQDFAPELMNLKVAADGEDGDGPSMDSIKKRDELYDSAIEVVIREGRGSCSLLQRCLGIGYGRAAKLIDYMAEDGIVGDYNGSKAREVVMTMAQWNAVQGIDDEPEQEPEPESEPEPKRASIDQTAGDDRHDNVTVAISKNGVDPDDEYEDYE